MDQIKIGKFIAKRRKNKNMTQMQLANKLGISEKTISKWENGRGLPDVSFFKPLCEELDISINDLLSGEIINNNDLKTKAEENILYTIQYSEKSKKVRTMYSCLNGMGYGLFISSLAISNEIIRSIILCLSLLLIVFTTYQNAKNNIEYTNDKLIKSDSLLISILITSIISVIFFVIDIKKIDNIGIELLDVILDTVTIFVIAFIVVFLLLKVINKAFSNIKYNKSSVIWIIVGIIISIILIFNVSMIGNKTYFKTKYIGNQDEVIFIPRFSYFDQECCMTAATFYSLVPKFILDKQINNYLKTFEYKDIATSVGYYKDNLIINDYIVKDYVLYREIIITYGLSN